MMKKYLVILMLSLAFMHGVKAQDFVVNNPVMGPTIPAPFPGMITTTFDFYVAGAPYTFSSDELSNDYATITFSFTKMNPTGITPSGTGAALFTWVLTDNGGTGVNKVYTYTGKTKNITMNQSPTAAKYKITFTNVPITFAATQAQTDVRVAGQFTDPGNAPTGFSANNNASIATYTSAGSPLPLLLMSFDATKQANSVLLNWQTSSEIGSSYFDIELSKDGNQWQSIGTVQAAGTSSSARNYNFTDLHPVNGVNYYRLGLADINGRVVYSVIRVVTFSLKGTVAVNPNPFMDKISIYLTSAQDEMISIKIYDAVGKQIQSKTVQAQKGSNQIQLNDLGSLSRGIYMLQIASSADMITQKLVK